MKRLILTALAVLTMVMPAAYGAAAVTEPVITRTVADMEGNTLLIEGLNLPARPAVFMGKVGGAVTKLPITKVTSRSIEAQLRETAPGSYIVAVALDSATYYTSMVTIGTPSIGKMTVVAKSGGSYDNPLDAIADIASWCGTPGEANPCLMKIMPGLYDLGSTSLQLPPYLTVEGSGEETTKLLGSVGTEAFPYLGLVILDDNTALKSLTVSNSGGGKLVAALSSVNKNDTKMRDVTLIATGGEVDVGMFLRFDLGFTENNSEIEHITVDIDDVGADFISGIYADRVGPTTMTDLKVQVKGYTPGSTATHIGIYNMGSLQLERLEIIVLGGAESVGLHNDQGICNVRDSSISAGGGTSVTVGFLNSRGSMTLQGSTIRGTALLGDVYSMYNITDLGSRTLSIVESTIGEIFSDANHTLNIVNSALLGAGATGPGTCIACNPGTAFISPSMHRVNEQALLLSDVVKPRSVLSKPEHTLAGGRKTRGPGRAVLAQALSQKFPTR